MKNKGGKRKMGGPVNKLSVAFGELLPLIEAEAKFLGISRSDYIRIAVRRALRRRKIGVVPFSEQPKTK